MHLIMDIKKIANNIWKVALSAHSGWRHPLLDVSRIRLRTSRDVSASQDELDLDAAVHFPFGISAQVFKKDGDGNSRWNH